MNSFATEILVVLAPIAFATLGVISVRKGMAGKVREGHNDVLVPLFLTAGTIYAVLLGFLVIAVWETYDQAKATCDEETSALATMYRETCGMPPQEQARMRFLVRDYTGVIVAKGWKIQATTGEAIPQARADVARMYREYSTMPPEQAASPINTQFLNTLQDMSIARNKRLIEANERLPWVLWLGLFVGAAIVVGMTFLLYMDAIWPHVLMSSALATMISTLLFITLVLNQPFRGPLALTDEPYVHAISVMDSVDRGS
jgi:hypothetical protein